VLQVTELGLGYIAGSGTSTYAGSTTLNPRVYSFLSGIRQYTAVGLIHYFAI